MPGPSQSTPEIHDSAATSASAVADVSPVAAPEAMNETTTGTAAAGGARVGAQIDHLPTVRPTFRGVVAPPLAEFGGPEGPEPTRYGDWERKGRCIDF